jgi:hypothetical protein
MTSIHGTRSSARRDPAACGIDMRAALPAALAAGGLALTARPLLERALLFKIRRDVRALNAGNIEPLLSNYAEDAVIHFNDGEHRWAGEHRGKRAIAVFLQSFVDAGLRGHVTELFAAGTPWSMTLIARTRWGRIVLHEDFYEDTQRIVALEHRLREREAPPA